MILSHQYEHMVLCPHLLMLVFGHKPGLEHFRIYPSTNRSQMTTLTGLFSFLCFQLKLIFWLIFDSFFDFLSFFWNSFFDLSKSPALSIQAYHIAIMFSQLWEDWERFNFSLQQLTDFIVEFNLKKIFRVPWIGWCSSTWAQLGPTGSWLIRSLEQEAYSGLTPGKRREGRKKVD